MVTSLYTAESGPQGSFCLILVSDNEISRILPMTSDLNFLIKVWDKDKKYKC